MDPEKIQWTIENRKNLYEILGVQRDADGPTLQRAYRHLMLLTHPDKVKGEAAQEACLAIMFAHQVLSDPQRRMLYDIRGFDGVTNNQQVTAREAARIFFSLMTVPIRYRAGTLNKGTSTSEGRNEANNRSDDDTMAIPMYACRITGYMFLAWIILLGVSGWASTEPPFFPFYS